MLFCLFLERILFSFKQLNLGINKKGFLEIFKEILGESTDWKSWKLRIRTIPPNPPFFVEGLFRFSRLCNHHDLYDLYLVIFPRLPVVGYVFLSPGRVTLTKAFPCVSPWQSHDFFPGQGWWPRCRFGKVPWRAAMALQALLATDGMPQKSGQRKTSWGCRCVPKQMFGNYHRHGW